MVKKGNIKNLKFYIIIDTEHEILEEKFKRKEKIYFELRIIVVRKLMYDR